MRTWYTIHWEIEWFFARLPDTTKYMGEKYTKNTIMSMDERNMNQAPTTAKSGALSGLFSTGVSADLAEGLLVDVEEGPGASGGPTLTFFFFLSNATQQKMVRSLEEE